MALVTIRQGLASRVHALTIELAKALTPSYIAMRSGCGAVETA